MNLGTAAVFYEVTVPFSSGR